MVRLCACAAKYRDTRTTRRRCYHRRMDTPWDTLITDCRLATLTDNGNAYGAIEHAAIGWKDGVRALWCIAKYSPSMRERLRERRAGRR